LTSNDGTIDFPDLMEGAYYYLRATKKSSNVVLKGKKDKFQFNPNDNPVLIQIE
jgi:hypothetical protein